jgi:hypothetical protein
MTYTAVNPHACCNWPRPEDAHATARPPPHPHASPHLTNNDGLRWKTDGRPPANGPPTTASQQRRHCPSTPAGARPDPPHPDPAHSCRHHPAKAKVRSPLPNSFFFYCIFIQHQHPHQQSEQQKDRCTVAPRIHSIALSASYSVKAISSGNEIHTKTGDIQLYVT